MFFGLTFFLFLGVYEAVKAVLYAPTAGTLAILAAWTAPFVGALLMLAFQEYRVQKAKGTVKMPVPFFEKMLIKRSRKLATHGKDSAL